MTNCTLNKMNAYVAKVTARTGLLLGGVKSVTCTPFEEFRDAVRWSDHTIETNKEANRDPMYDGIHMVYSKDPITKTEVEGKA